MIIRRLMALVLGLGVAAGPAQVHGETVDVDGGQLYYESCGSGPRAIVLVHDGLIDSTGFDAMWPVLCKDFRVVRYDRRGYGRSPVAKAAYSQTDDLAAVIAAARLDRVSLVGFSAGGGVALDYALDHPQAVERLILVGAQINGFTQSDHFNRRTNRNFIPILLGDVDGVAANWAKDPYLILPGDEAARAKAIAILKANPQNIAHLRGDPARPGPSALPRMPGLKVPTLILVGDHDIADVHAAAGAAQALIPGSKRVVLADSAHLIQLERPRELAAMIGDFVRKGR